MGVVAGDVVLEVGFSSVVRKVVSAGTGVPSCVVREFLLGTVELLGG